MSNANGQSSLGNQNLGVAQGVDIALLIKTTNGILAANSCKIKCAGAGVAT